MEEVEGNQRSEDGRKAEENILQFMDSMDSYLTLLDSMSSTLRQGWLELASARHSMGASRVNSALFDLKLHSAVTTLQVAEQDGESPLADPMVKQSHFTLCKWASPNGGKCCSEEIEDGDKLQKKSPQLRHRGLSQFSELQEKLVASSGAPLIVEDQVQKERSKSLSVFGTLVSPKLRGAQFSFETALVTLVEIANMRSLMLSAFAQVRQEMEGRKE
ncbi:hypothetical protein HHK36_010467 [Tetracentron sinense]|uniref:Vacuolar ATPase assembly protein VMA22 n=1 Tax=Tetracentron sinense TaxID=13715 RepID=A0A834ZEA5_TETSI|nr:hypothetical protein HHK36_010467 [Tetracentron sinense]